MFESSMVLRLVLLIEKNLEVTKSQIYTTMTMMTTNINVQLAYLYLIQLTAVPMTLINEIFEMPADTNDLHQGLHKSCTLNRSEWEE